MKQFKGFLQRLVPAFISESTDGDDYDVVVRIWWIATSFTAVFTLILTLVLYATGVPILPLFTAIHTGFWLTCLLVYAFVRKAIQSLE